MKKHNNIVWAFWLNLSFALIELVGAFLTNSVAIASDALHDLGDGLAIGLSWYLEGVSNRTRDERFSFGYKRFSLLAVLINCLILIFGSTLMLRETIPRLFEPAKVHPNGMLFLAVLGLIFNGAAALKLHGKASLNERVLSLHFLEDILGWVAVLISALFIKITNWSILDPILSLLISCWVIWNASKRLKETLTIFLQSIPESLDLKQVEQRILAHQQVLGVHDSHLWSMDGRQHVFSSHILLKSYLKPEQLSQLKEEIKHDLVLLGIGHVTLELESEGDSCLIRAAD